MQQITVFCGSSPGKSDVYERYATTLGEALAKRNTGLVYGGARIGLMGAVADGALNAGGKVTGVLPDFLKAKELAHEGLTELIIVKSMHERKTKMHDLCDGIIALPGGFGTLEELFEVLTWAQLGLHEKPIGLLNINGYYDALLELLQNMVNNRFLKAVNQQMLLVSDDVDDLLEKMETYSPPVVGKWIRQKGMT